MQTLGQLAALGTAVCWTVTSLSFEAAGRRVGSLQVNLIRLIFAFLMFTAFGAIFHGRLLPLDAGSHVWTWLLLSGLVGFVIGDMFLFQAFVDVGARTAMLVYSSVPPMTAVLGWIILGERLTPIQLLAMALTVAGIMTVTTARVPAEIEDPTSSSGEALSGAVVRRPHRTRGIWFAVVGALGQAAGLVLSRYGAPSYDPFGATQIRTIAGVVGFAALFAFSGRWRRIGSALRDGRAVRHILRGSFFGPFLGVSLGLLAAQRAGTGVASTIIATVPVLLIPVSIALFHEKVTVREGLGAIVAVAGVALLFLA
jgi:drug/metabolite transporter (DMT)-like permease